MARNDISATITTLFNTTFSPKFELQCKHSRLVQNRTALDMETNEAFPARENNQADFTKLEEKNTKMADNASTKWSGQINAGQANEAWAIYKSTPSRVSWGDPSSETQGRSVGSGKTAAKVLKTGERGPGMLHLTKQFCNSFEFLSLIGHKNIFVPNCRPESIALLL